MRYLVVVKWRWSSDQVGDAYTAFTESYDSDTIINASQIRTDLESRCLDLAEKVLISITGEMLQYPIVRHSRGFLDEGFDRVVESPEELPKVLDDLVFDFSNKKSFLQAIATM